MKEIKFRCWSEKGKAYLDGPGRFLWVSHDYTTSGLYSPTDLQVTLEQYTGLKDKNGKEIYEGDIVALLFGYVPMKSVTTENIRIENAQKAVKS